MARIDVQMELPLFYAASVGNLKATKILIHSKADVNKANKFKRAPLWHTVRKI